MDIKSKREKSQASIDVLIEILEKKLNERENKKMTEKKKTQKEKIKDLLYENFPPTTDIQIRTKETWTQDMAGRILKEIIKK